MKTRRTTPQPSAGQASLLIGEMKARKGKRWQKLTEEEHAALIAMLSVKAEVEDLDVDRLTPAGSFISKIAREFTDTDISYSLPVFSVVMYAASWLTQAGAYLDVPGLEPILPTLWTIGLAESGSSKSFAMKEIRKILAPEDGASQIRRLPEAATAAQWILDLANDNGAFWFQDEVGKFFNAVLKQGNLAQMKPWMLNAYSHETISNRIKGEVDKLVIEQPAFTFLGLTVLSSWKDEIDATSMLDGFCQRMNYFVAKARTDTDMFEHFLNRAGPDVDERRHDLHELWQALCAQPCAAGPYTLGLEVLPFLEKWWRELRTEWGDFAVPASFIRRIGYSVLRYLVVLHFLLGKARWPIDVETARLATFFAEYHLQSARVMLQHYDRNATSIVQTIAEKRAVLSKRQKPATARNISRLLSKQQRAQISNETIVAVLEGLDAVRMEDGNLPDFDGDVRTRCLLLMDAVGRKADRLALNERKRNERRLRNLRNAYRASSNGSAGTCPPSPQGAGNIVQLTLGQHGPDTPACEAGTGVHDLTRSHRTS